MHDVTIHDQSYEFYSWETLGADSFALAKKIIESGEKFDRVVALAKGGLTFARSLVDYLAVEQLSSFQIEFYTAIGKHGTTPVITQNLPVSVRDEHVLLFDDLVDQGTSLETATAYLRQQGVKSLKTATLLRKPWTTFEPDFWVRETTAWVIFPNEIRETIANVSKIWREKGDSPEKISSQLLELGFSAAEVALFANPE